MDSLLGSVVFATVVASLYHTLKKKGREDVEEVEVHGGCHCGSVRWTIRCLRRTCVWVCNCSVCNMKQNHHIVVNDDSFFLEQCEDDALTTYTFGTHAAQVSAYTRIHVSMSTHVHTCISTCIPTSVYVLPSSF